MVHACPSDLTNITAAVRTSASGLVSWSALWQGDEVYCEPLTPSMPLLNMAQIEPAILACLVRLLKATAVITLLLRQEHTKRLAGQELRILDSDWAGPEGKVKYPCLNRTSITWPEGATSGALILKKHDQSMMRSSVSQPTAQASVSASRCLDLSTRPWIFCKHPTSARTTSTSRLRFA